MMTRLFLPQKFALFLLAPVLVASLAFLILTGAIARRTHLARQAAPQPQAILMLGGNFDREVFTAGFARQQEQELEIWVSSGLEPETAIAIFQQAGIPNHRLYLDYRAVDTVTNFSTLVPDFKQRNIQHVYLLTSDFHLPRASAIARIILGSQGIVFTPIAIPSGDPPEPKWRVIRDVARSLLWVVSRRTGATLNPRINVTLPNRRYGIAFLFETWN